MLHPDDGYFYGIGAFETIAVEHGVPQLWDAHLARLQRAMDFLGLTASLAEIRSQAEAVLKKPELQTGRKVLKLTVSAENLLVTFRDNPYTEADYARGFTTALSPVLRNETSPFTYHKTLNYGDCLLEKRRCKASGVDEPIFRNTRGELCEGATTNVFFGKDGRLFTPPVTCGMLPGVMRAHVCSRFDVTERVIRPEEAAEFDEMFLTNSLLGVMPVKSLDGFVFPSTELAKRLPMQHP